MKNTDEKWWDKTAKQIVSCESIDEDYAMFQLICRAANGQAEPVVKESSGWMMPSGDARERAASLGLTIVTVYPGGSFVAVDDGAYVEVMNRDADGAAIKVLCNGEARAKAIIGALTRDWKKLVVKERPGVVHMLVFQHGGLNFRSIGEVGLPFERGNYSDVVQCAFDTSAKALGSPDPHGRLVLFEGPPGCGKTHIVRSLIETLKKDCFFALLAASDIEKLSRPEILPALIDQKERLGAKKFVLICEDADACLVPRGDKSIGSISALLNLSDGIIGSALDIRVVATTNAVVNEIDPALLRPGRLLLRSTVAALGTIQQKEILRRLGVNPEVATPVERTLAEVYALADRARSVSDRT